MRLLPPLLAILLFAVNTAHGSAKQNEFDYTTQIGTAEVTSKGHGCLTIVNPKLRENQLLKLVILGETQKVVENRTGKKLKSSCSRNPEVSPNASFYEFPAGKEHFGSAIAVVGFAGDFKIVKGEVRADLNGDGTSESFRSCTSYEGLHLTVWAGDALKSKRLWHEYYYLGYDLEPSCNPADYKD